MAIGLYGYYYSFTASAVSVGEDLVSTIATRLGGTRATNGIVPKKLTLISSGSLALDINGLGVYSTLFADADGLYKLALDGQDVQIKSMVSQAVSACAVFLAVVF
jgi:hypothetical protein